MKKKPNLVLFVSSICALALGMLSIVAGVICLMFVDSNVSTILFIVGSILCVAGLVFVILHFMRNGFKPVNEEPTIIVKEVKTVDVKEVKETREEQLFKEYEKLFKEGLITKEELEQKRKEAGLTQEEFAIRSGLGLRFVRELEQGKETVRMDKVNQALAMFGMEAVPGRKDSK